MNKKEQIENLFTQHYTGLLRFAEQMVPDKEECCDIVSAAYEDLWRKYETLSNDSLRSYLYKVVRNKCIDFLRRQGVHQRYIEKYKIITDTFTTQDKLAEQDERRHRVQQVLNLLQPPTLEIFEACYLEHKKYKEVADEMGISLATVKKHIVKALSIIRENFIKK